MCHFYSNFYLYTFLFILQTIQCSNEAPPAAADYYSPLSIDLSSPKSFTLNNNVQYALVDSVPLIGTVGVH